MGLLDLSPEILCCIAEKLDAKDVCTFSLICRQTFYAICSPKSGVWRALYVKHYDNGPDTTTSTMRMILTGRHKYLTAGAAFVRGDTINEISCLNVIRDLMNESFAYGSPPTKDSLNVQAIVKFAQRHRLMGLVATANHLPKSTDLLLAVQTILTPLRFGVNIATKTTCYGYEESLRASFALPLDLPLFRGEMLETVNLRALTHIVNFFKKHLVEKDATTDYRDFISLAEKERPKLWSQAFDKTGVRKLGHRWICEQATMDPRDMRQFFAGRWVTSGFIPRIYLSALMENFSDLDLEFADASAQLHWPEEFERQLDSRSPPSTIYVVEETKKDLEPPLPKETASKKRKGKATKDAARDLAKAGSTAQRRKETIKELHDFTIHGGVRDMPAPESIQFQGKSVHRGIHPPDRTAGWLNPLPPQQGIAGWARFTMMRYPESREKRYPRNRDQASDILSFNMANTNRNTVGLAYEGVVLPGGNIIIGRWWHPRPDNVGVGLGRVPPKRANRNVWPFETGPFIFWQVADPADDDD